MFGKTYRGWKLQVLVAGKKVFTFDSSVSGDTEYMWLTRTLRYFLRNKIWNGVCICEKEHTGDP